MNRPAAAESINRVAEEELLQKWVGIWGQLGRAGADRGPLGALRVKIVLTTSEQAIRLYNAWRFRSQKGNVGLGSFPAKAMRAGWAARR